MRVQSYISLCIAELVVLVFCFSYFGLHFGYWRFFSLSLSFRRISFRVICRKMNSFLGGSLSLSFSGRVSPRGELIREVSLWSPLRGFEGRAANSTPNEGFFERTPPRGTPSVSPIFDRGPDIDTTSEELSWADEPSGEPSDFGESGLQESQADSGIVVSPHSARRRLSFGGRVLFSVTPPMRPRNWRVMDASWTGVRGRLQFGEDGNVEVVPGRREITPPPVQRSRRSKICGAECASVMKCLDSEEQAQGVGDIAGSPAMPSVSLGANKCAIPRVVEEAAGVVPSSTVFQAPKITSPTLGATAAEAATGSGEEADEESASDSWLYKDPGFTKDPKDPSYLWKGIDLRYNSADPVPSPSPTRSPVVVPAPRRPLPFRIYEDRIAQNFSMSPSTPPNQEYRYEPRQQLFNDSEESSFVCDRSSCHERLVKRLIYGTISSSPCQGRLARQMGNVTASLPVEGERSANSSVCNEELIFELSPSSPVSSLSSMSSLAARTDEESDIYADLNSSFEDTFWDAKFSLEDSSIDEEASVYSDAESSFSDLYLSIDCSNGSATFATPRSDRIASANA